MNSLGLVATKPRNWAGVHGPCFGSPLNARNRVVKLKALVIVLGNRRDEGYLSDFNSEVSPSGDSAQII